MIFTTRTNGLTYHGTNAERLASFPQPRREGLEYHETDTDALYKVVKGEWVGIGGGGGGAHNIIGTQHTVVGNQWDIVGLTGVNSLGLLSSSDNPGANPVILRTNSDGFISVQAVGIGGLPVGGSYGIYINGTGKLQAGDELTVGATNYLLINSPQIDISSDEINLTPVGTSNVYIQGGLTLGNAALTTTGAIQWTGTDFEGYDGTNWLSLTATGGAGGEVNTASNVGTGDGWFKQKTGVNLEFLSLLSADAITKTVGADEITIGLNQSQINHTNLLNIGTNSHDQIDTHIASTSNPHSVTYGQVGAAPTTHSHVEADITDLNHLDTNAIHDNVAGEIVLIAEKATPVSADIIIIEDSADSNNKKRVQIGNLPGGGSGSSTFLGLTDTINSYTSGRVLFESGSDVVDDPDLTFDGAILTVGGGVNSLRGEADGVGIQPLASNLYIRSRGMNLLANGSGLLGNNYNFSAFTFDQVETHGGKGSFQNGTNSASPTSDEAMPIDGEKTYRLSLWAKATTYVAGAHAYFGVALYDIDDLSILPYYYMRIVNTDTTLAADLNPGDTTITLTDGTNWLGSSSNAYQRQMIIFNYSNSYGYTYPPYTYSRNNTRNDPNYRTDGLWAVGGISGNVITLTDPWPASLGSIPAGTAVSNGNSGSSYKYIAAVNIEVPNAWTNYSGKIGGWDTGGVGYRNKFPYGTASIKLLFLMNRDVTGNVTNVSDLWFSEVAGDNIEVATPTQQGVVSTVAQSFAGVKVFNDRVGIGSGSPAGVLEVDGNDTSDVIFRDAALKFYDATTLRWTLHNTPTSSPYSADTSIHISYSNDVGGSFPFNSYGNLVLQGRSDNSSYGGLAVFTGISPTDPSFVVLPSGKVGIGTSAPYDQCHIRGENAKIRIGHNANNAGEVGVNFSHVYTVNAQQKTAIISKAIGTWGRSNLHFVLNSAGDSTNYSVPTDTKMIVLNNGNVGIGTTAPGSRLHIHKVTTQNSTQEFATYSYLGAAPTSTATVGYEGIRGYAESNASVYIPTITGGVFYGDLGSSGDVNDLRGLEAYANLTGSGHATNANGIKIDIFRSGSGTIGTAVGLSIANINEGSTNYAILTNGGTVKIGASGLVVGNPTGGDKGTGTINAQAVYDDNTLLTDYVFEPEYDLLSIDQTTSFYKKNYHLPTIFGRDEWEREGGYSLGKLVSQLWETVEVQAIHITRLNERLKQLET